METLGQKRTRESGMGKGFKVGGLETLGHKRTRESGMEKGFKVGGIGDSRPKKNQRVRNGKWTYG